MRLAGDTVSVLDAIEVPDHFDARFSAIRRHYLYRILSRRGQPALDAHRAWWVAKPLDAIAMQAAADRLVGRHDFTTFRSTHCQAKSPVRTLDRLSVTVEGEEIHIRASAQSFLHNQIRSLAGTLKLVGEGRWTPDDVQRALEACDRKACGRWRRRTGSISCRWIIPRWKRFAHRQPARTGRRNSPARRSAAQPSPKACCRSCAMITAGRMKSVVSAMASRA